jgi:hypothetical protein
MSATLRNSGSYKARRHCKMVRIISFCWFLILQYYSQIIGTCIGPWQSMQLRRKVQKEAGGRMGECHAGHPQIGQALGVGYLN